MSISMQTDSFRSDGDLAIDPSFGTATRTLRDTHTWIELVSDWLSGSDKRCAFLAIVRS
jgi:hypothetical protein